MKCNLKALSAALIISVLAIAAVPAIQVCAATEFTYAEQTSKKEVTSLEMRPQETADLCFLGVPDYQSYTCTWTSSDETVATVDKMGVITAKAQGTAEITLTIGDGSVYTSNPVTVTVISMTLTAGNQSNKNMDVVELKKDATLDLNFYGVTDWSIRKSGYLTEWTTSDEAIVQVNQSNGMLTAVSEGTAIIIFNIYDMEKDVLLSSAPVTVIVTK